MLTPYPSRRSSPSPRCSSYAMCLQSIQNSSWLAHNPVLVEAHTHRPLGSRDDVGELNGWCLLWDPFGRILRWESSVSPSVLYPNTKQHDTTQNATNSCLEVVTPSVVGMWSRFMRFWVTFTEPVDLAVFGNDHYEMCVALWHCSEQNAEWPSWAVLAQKEAELVWHHLGEDVWFLSSVDFNIEVVYSWSARSVSVNFWNLGSPMEVIAPIGDVTCFRSTSRPVRSVGRMLGCAFTFHMLWTQYAASNLLSRRS